MDLLNESQEFDDDQDTAQGTKKVLFETQDSLDSNDQEDNENTPPVTWANWMSLAVIFMI